MLNAQKASVGVTTEIRECQKTGSKSLCAIVEFRQGQIISKFSAAEILNCPNQLTVQVGDDKHIVLLPKFLQYTNHSCRPNIFFDTQNWVVTALQEIEIGAELTFFYPSTEWSMDQEFDCACQSEACLGYIQGAAYLSPDVLTKYRLSQHIQQKLVHRPTSFDG